MPSDVGRTFSVDAGWIFTMAGCAVAESIWWLVCWTRGVAPLPLLPLYVVLALGGLGAAWLVRTIVAPKRAASNWGTVAAALLIVALAASLFLPLKFAIPAVRPFWLDVPIAAAEHALFGADPWLLLDRLLGWAAIPIDRLYALWLPVQLLVLFSVILDPASPGKSRALIAYSLAWFGLGVIAALLLSSAGPLFYDRLYGGDTFSALRETLVSRGATAALSESDRMWAAYEQNKPGLVAGISAIPSLHVAVSLWIYLVARQLAPRAAPAALGYTLFIWVASVQLGWHYVADGAAGALGMLGLWALAGAIEVRTRSIRMRSLCKDSIGAAVDH